MKVWALQLLSQPRGCWSHKLREGIPRSRSSRTCPPAPGAWSTCMPDEITLMVSGRNVSVAHGATVAVAVTVAGMHWRNSVTGEPRGPLCGMGICFECRVEIDGALHQRSCQILCAAGMDVRTYEQRNYKTI